MVQPSPTRLERSSSPIGESASRLAVLVSVHRIAGVGLTDQIRALLRCQPMRWMSLRDVMDSLPEGSGRRHASWVLCRMSRGHGDLVRAVEKNADRSGKSRHFVTLYKWRTPQDGRP